MNILAELVRLHGEDVKQRYTYTCFIFESGAVLNDDATPFVKMLPTLDADMFTLHSRDENWITYRTSDFFETEAGKVASGFKVRTTRAPILPKVSGKVRNPPETVDFWKLVKDLGWSSTRKTALNILKWIEVNGSPEQQKLSVLIVERLKSGELFPTSREAIEALCNE